VSVLDPEVHRQLIADLPEIARTAGIPPRYIQTSMTEFCDKPEIDWVRGYHEHVEKGHYGACFVGREHATQMMAMVGALTRNFVLAQLWTLNNLIDMLRTNEPINASVLFLPSFHVETKKGEGLTAFQKNLLWQCLEERMLAEKQTVIGVHSLQLIAQDYGAHFRQLLDNHYEVL
jgi:hypothetical protein